MTMLRLELLQLLADTDQAPTESVSLELEKVFLNGYVFAVTCCGKVMAMNP